ncbi:hypothetical protein BC830DRAFT_1086337 [Chytriomyces sp. MP71]|nr:hypothetical protein BC830DRAFT_1086337 [Chytriomyces sp. MP71]
MGQSGCNRGCGGAARVLDNLQAVSSHELIETVTDPAQGGWYEAYSPYWEIGDVCNAQQGSVVGVNGQAYVVQLQWSNQAQQYSDSINYPCSAINIIDYCASVVIDYFHAFKNIDC